MEVVRPKGFEEWEEGSVLTSEADWKAKWMGLHMYKECSSDKRGPTNALTVGVGVAAGRLIFGLGGECVVVGQSAFVSAWFKVTTSL